MAHVIPLWDIPSLAVRDSKDLYPVRRIFCVGRNYVEHQKEMGGDGRETPFFFLKAAHALVPGGGNVHYPPKTANYHYETEMVVAIGKGGRRIDAKKANDHVYGYGVGLDMTRRDLQNDMKKQGRPWCIGKAFEQSAPIGPIVPIGTTGELTTGAISLTVNGQARQSADLKDLIWNVNETIEHLSAAWTLQPGDLIYSGTPAGVAAVVRGDVMEGHIAGLPSLRVAIR
jgi:fumarylpyruvate hydrolase